MPDLQTVEDPKEAPEGYVAELRGKDSLGNDVVQEVSVVPMGPTQLAADREPWEKQPNESAKEYAAFQSYMLLEPTVRSIAKAYTTHTGIRRPEGAPHWWCDTAIARRWEERATAYDDRVNGLFLTALEGYRVRSRVLQAQLGRAMQQKALEAVQSMRTIIYDEDGNPRATLSASAIAKLADIGTKIERLALELSTENVASHVRHSKELEEEDQELVHRAKAIIEAREADITAPD